MMKKTLNQHTKKRISMARIAFVILIPLLMASFVFTLHGFLVTAFTQDDLETAQAAESQLRQELADARAEAARLGTFKERLADEGLTELIENAVVEAQDNMNGSLSPIADNFVSDMIDIYNNDTYDDIDRHNAASAAVDKATGEINGQMSGVNCGR